MDLLFESTDDETRELHDLEQHGEIVEDDGNAIRAWGRSKIVMRSLNWKIASVRTDSAMTSQGGDIGMVQRRRAGGRDEEEKKDGGAVHLER
jgi:hypothetical protein